jgi:hypothetical protein
LSSNSFYTLDEFFKRWLYYICWNWVVLIMLLYWMILFIRTYQYLGECIVVISMLSFPMFLMFLLLEYSYAYWCLLCHILSDVYDYMYFVLCNCDYFHILESYIPYGFMEDE